MCSLGEADLAENGFMEEKNVDEVRELLCRKCNEVNATVNLRVKDAYCRECFLIVSTHKFRSCLGKSKLVRSHDHVLIAHSGGQSSTALLHLIWTGLKGPTHKRLFFKASVLYIDEGAVLSQSSEERRTTCFNIKEQVCSLGFQFYQATLSQSLKLTEILEVGGDLNIDTNADMQLCDLVHSVCSLTAKEDLVQKLRNNLIVTLGQHMKCTKIFVAENCDQIATKILANVSLGRGAQLPFDVGFCNSHHTGIMVVRPLRTFTKKEVAFYNFYNSLEPMTIPSLQTKLDSHASIQRLTERFVAELQENFPATVSTIFRTSDKLAGQQLGEGDECCALCQGLLDTEELQSSALQATNFSRLVSAIGPSGFSEVSVGASQTVVSDKPVCCDCKCSSANTPLFTKQNISEALCYGCRLILDSMSVLDYLPQDVLSTAKKKVARHNMKKEIEDFLL